MEAIRLRCGEKDGRWTEWLLTRLFFYGLATLGNILSMHSATAKLKPACPILSACCLSALGQKGWLEVDRIETVIMHMM